MRTTVAMRDFAEIEIRTSRDLARLHELAAQDIPTILMPQSRPRITACPACDSSTIGPAFVKSGLAYDRCTACRSLFANPRPDADRLQEYYRTSSAARFWRQQIFGPGRDARRAKIARPTADWIRSGIAEHRPEAAQILDLSSNGQDHVEELIARLPSLESVVVAGPLADLEWVETARHGIRLSPCSFEVTSLPPGQDAVIALEFLDRTVSPASLFDAAWAALRPGGLFFVTGPCASGFDAQVLGDAWPTLVPPDRLTVPSIEGLKALAGRRGWRLLELSTPGMFDVETVQAAIQASPTTAWPEFIRYLVDQRDEGTHYAFQEFLQAHRLSSFARLLLQRPEGG